jgi:DNA-binding XRE family transcriptional regulator
MSLPTGKKGVKMMSKQYMQELEQAQANLADVKVRGEEALGDDWDELRRELFTPEEIAVSDLRVAMMIEFAEARKAMGFSQKKLEELSGVKQPVIARMERGSTKPQLDTFLKALAPLGKTLYIGDIAR